MHQARTPRAVFYIHLQTQTHSICRASSSVDLHVWLHPKKTHTTQRKTIQTSRKKGIGPCSKARAFLLCVQFWSQSLCSMTRVEKNKIKRHKRNLSHTGFLQRDKTQQSWRPPDLDWKTYHPQLLYSTWLVALIYRFWMSLCLPDECHPS